MPPFGSVRMQFTDHLLVMPISKGQTPPGVSPNLEHEFGRRRVGRQEFDNHRLLRLLRDPLSGSAQGSIDLALLPPTLKFVPSSLGATVLAAFILWGLIAALVVLL